MTPLDRTFACSCALAFDTDQMHHVVDAVKDVLGRGTAVIDAWLQFSRRNKVVGILYANLIRSKPLLQAEPHLSYALEAAKQLYQPIAQHRTRLYGEFKRLTTQIELTEVMGIKGLALQAHYPRPYQRHLNDIDLFCCNPESAYALAHDLQQQGYEIGKTEPPWIRRLDPQLQAKWKFSSPYAGQINMVRFIDASPCRLDIHFTLYSISFTPVLPAHLKADKRTARWQQLPLEVPNLENSLLVLVAHMLSQGALLSKDLNDLVVLTGQPLDWDKIWTLAAASGIDDVLSQALHLTQTIVPWYTVPPHPAQAMVKHLLKPFAVNWLRRALLNAYSTYQFEQRQHSHGAALRYALRCFHYYNRRLTPQVDEGTASLFRQVHALPDRLENLERSDCLRLLPPQLVLPQLAPMKVVLDDDRWKTSHLGEARALYARNRENPALGLFVMNDNLLLPTLTYRFEQQTLDEMIDILDTELVLQR